MITSAKDWTVRNWDTLRLWWESRNLWEETIRLVRTPLRSVKAVESGHILWVHLLYFKCKSTYTCKIKLTSCHQRTLKQHLHSVWAMGDTLFPGWGCHHDSYVPSQWYQRPHTTKVSGNCWNILIEWWDELQAGIRIEHTEGKALYLPKCVDITSEAVWEQPGSYKKTFERKLHGRSQTWNARISGTFTWDILGDTGKGPSLLILGFTFFRSQLPVCWRQDTGLEVHGQDGHVCEIPELSEDCSI